MQNKNHVKRGKYLSFFLNSRAYAVPIESVREIDRVSNITYVPKSPSFIAGVMNLRGKVIPVVDLRLRLDMPKIPYGKWTCIVVVETESGHVGVIVDSVNAVIDLEENQLEPRPSTGMDGSEEFVMGMGKTDTQVIVLLDIVNCLSKKNLLSSTDNDLQNQMVEEN